MTVSSIIAKLDRELAPKGFLRRGSTWNRDQGPLVEVVDVQTSKGAETMTMNAGVLSRPTFFLCWGRDAGQFIEEPFCTVRARVGQLLETNDQWWNVRDVGAAEKMVECLRAQVLPFLERMRSLEAMRDWLSAEGVPSPKLPLPSICFAVLQSQLGRNDVACGVLAELESKALGAWKSRASEVAARIHCERAAL